MAFFSGNKQADNSEETAKNVFLFQLAPKNVLVTGSNGQLGSELKRVAEQHEDNLKFFFADIDTLDITNHESVDAYVKDNAINYIINCAAYTAVDKAEDDAELAAKLNRDAVYYLAIAAKENGAKMIQVSTDYVFDGKKTTAYKETDAVDPQSVYGTTKAEGEAMLLRTLPQSGAIIRTSWLYSIYGNNFVKTMMKLGRERDELNVVADQVGSPTNARDLARAIVAMLDYSEAKQFMPGIYHYSNEGSTNWCDFTKEIHRLSGIECKVNGITTAEYPTKAARPQYSLLDKTKIKVTFNIAIPQWEDSLAECIKELEA